MLYEVITNALWLRTADGQDVTCVQIAGLVARRILCYVNRITSYNVCYTKLLRSASPRPASACGWRSRAGPIRGKAAPGSRAAAGSAQPSAGRISGLPRAPDAERGPRRAQAGFFRCAARRALVLAALLEPCLEAFVEVRIDRQLVRITSYNVCYTKLLRASSILYRI